jgi:hypothetical protein
VTRLQGLLVTARGGGWFLKFGQQDTDVQRRALAQHSEHTQAGAGASEQFEQPP